MKRKEDHTNIQTFFAWSKQLQSTVKQHESKRHSSPGTKGQLALKYGRMYCVISDGALVSW